MSAVTFEIPPSASGDNWFIFKRDFFAAIRGAIAKAQAAGEIDEVTCVTCMKALPPPTSDQGAAA